MKGLYSLLFFFFWFCCIISMQVLLFMNGFLLTRVSQFLNSTCTTNIDCSNQQTCNNILFISERFSEPTQQICFQHGTKVIILIIDAFRYDFALYNTTLQHPEMYQNKLKVLHKLLTEEHENSRLFAFIADPPTTTMQRLKGITTGSLPTFIDAGSNFATHEINEDNILDQLVNNKYRTVFMGDDTWTGLYPNRFVRSFPYPSFNVWDLDTVDNGVLKHLYEEIDKNDWKLLVAHFLGVDHCGHRYGPSHPEMSRKLTQMNGVIEKVIGQLDNDTVLFVIGDHGMTDTGDHGGESRNEINAAMFAYSKKPFAEAYHGNNYSVKQVDLVPTLSILLGVPIPHSSLGSLIHDCIPAGRHSWEQATLTAWENAQQLTNYIREYAKTSDLFTDDKLNAIFEGHRQLNMKFKQVQSKKDALEFTQEVNEFIIMVRQMCEKIWIQFDAFSMARGLLLISTVTIFAYLLIDGLDDIPEVINKQFVTLCYISSGVAFAFSYILFTFHQVDSLANTTYFASGLCALVILAYTTIRHFQVISSALYAGSKTRSWIDILNRAILAFTALMLLSNSFILEESKVMLFFLLTLIILQLVQFVLVKLQNKNVTYQSIAKSKMLFVILIMCTLVRLSMNYWRCREEQGCNNSIFLSSKIVGGRLEWVLAAITSIAFIVLSRFWLTTCGNLNGLSVSTFVAKYVPTVTVLCISGFWILHGLPAETRQKLLGPMQSDILAWAAFGGIISGVITITMQPLCIFHLNDNTKKLQVEGDNIIPQLARYVFDNKVKKPPVVFGLATVYSAPFLVMLINIALIWLLLLDYVVVPSCIALLCTSGLVLLVNSILKFEKASNINNLLTVSSTDRMIWYILSIYMFYATGHQPAFPNISWEAAFVGTVGQDGQLINNTIPAILVLINSFGSYLVMGIGLPLLLIAPFTFHAITPSFLNKKSKVSLHRGEMELYDNEQETCEILFKLMSKYVICHIVRVFTIMLSSTIHCRHLMVWNVFAPKLIFESIALFVTLAAVFLGFLLFIHVNQKLDKFVVKLCKQGS